MCQSLLNPLKAMGTQLCRPEALGSAPAVCPPPPHHGNQGRVSLQDSVYFPNCTWGEAALLGLRGAIHPFPDRWELWDAWAREQA